MASKKGRKRAPVKKKSPGKPSMDPMEMMKGMSPEDMMGMMHEMMPKMMERCSDFMSMMHEEMPKIMRSCFGKMDAEQRASTLSMCRSVLNDLEKQA